MSNVHESLFGPESYRLLREHVDEFFTDPDWTWVTHRTETCNWDYEIKTSVSVWGLRGIALRHMRQDHPEYLE